MLNAEKIVVDFPKIWTTKTADERSHLNIPSLASREMFNIV